MYFGDDGDENPNIGNMQSCDIRIPHIRYDYDETEIGTLRFMYSKSRSFPVINDDYLNSPDFDGWVYPDGTIFNVVDVERFSKALSCYGISETSFQVPNLSGFFKCTGYPLSNFQEHEQFYPITRHTHDMSGFKIDARFDIDGSTSLPTYSTS